MDPNIARLWNDLPLETRERLMPHQIQKQITLVEHARNIAVRAHQIHLMELDQWLVHLRERLRKATERQP